MLNIDNAPVGKGKVVWVTKKLYDKLTKIQDKQLGKVVRAIVREFANKSFNEMAEIISIYKPEAGKAHEFAKNHNEIAYFSFMCDYETYGFLLDIKDTFLVDNVSVIIDILYMNLKDEKKI